MKKYVLAIDQGTTSSRVVVVDRYGDILHKEQMALSQIAKKDGTILQNPYEIYETIETLIKRLFDRYEIHPEEIESIGITNQRETTILWEKTTGKILYQAISWQSKQTLSICEDWIKKGYENIVKRKTGLTINPYFSASKIKYILDLEKPNADVLFGTVDTYILWRLTKGKVHKTDVTNASRTMLYNLETKDWDDELLSLFGIPKRILPTIHANDHFFGYYQFKGEDIPIHGMIGDQQSSLLGHQCFLPGEIKNTYGTGCFMLMNTGQTPCFSKRGLLTTVAWSIKHETIYALEGSVFIGGAAIQWIRDKLEILDTAANSEKEALQSLDDDLFLVPAFVGLGTPYWDSNVRGSLLGLKASTTRKDIIKATLNSIAYQVCDILQVMKKEAKLPILSLAVDGGASVNKYLMQFQADILETKLIQNEEVEITALGAAYLAGLASGFWEDMETLKKNRKIAHIFYPLKSKKEARKLYKNWQLAVAATRQFKI